MTKWCICLLVFLESIKCFAGDTNPADTAAPKHSPKKAVILSAILPGLGQVYNQKYWKVPIVYALGGFCIYNVSKNNVSYRAFKEGFKLLADTNNGIVSVIINNAEYTEAQCKSNRDLFRRQRDLNIFATALIYTLNIIDANVDAHFFGFKMNDDLSLNIKPAVNYQMNQFYFGFSGQMNIYHHKKCYPIKK